MAAYVYPSKENRVSVVMKNYCVIKWCVVTDFVVFADAVLSFAGEKYIEQNNVKHMCKSFWKKVELKKAGRGPSVVLTNILSTIWKVPKAGPYNKMQLVKLKYFSSYWSALFELKNLHLLLLEGGTTIDSSLFSEMLEDTLFVSTENRTKAIKLSFIFEISKVKRYVIPTKQQLSCYKTMIVKGRLILP